MIAPTGFLRSRGQNNAALREIPLAQDPGEPRQRPEIALEATTPGLPGAKWFVLLVICAFAATVAFVYFDVPIARAVSGVLGAIESLGKGFASAILLGIEATVAVTLACIRITRGHLSRFGETTALACLTSICAYAVNDAILKRVCGVPNPGLVMDGVRHSFNLLKGTANSSFPSGHMVLAGSFAGVFMRLYRPTIGPLAALLLIAAVLLIVGDWHFVSDVIVGTFLGISAGLLAGEVWLAHST